MRFEYWVDIVSLSTATVSPACPRCKQGDMYYARLRKKPEMVFVICEECDTVWPQIHLSFPATCNGSVNLEDYLKERSFPPLWDDIVIVTTADAMHEKFAMHCRFLNLLKVITEAK